MGKRNAEIGRPPQRNGDPYDGNAPDRRAEPGQRNPDGQVDKVRDRKHLYIAGAAQDSIRRHLKADHTKEKSNEFQIRFPCLDGQGRGRFIQKHRDDRLVKAFQYDAEQQGDQDNEQIGRLIPLRNALFFVGANVLRRIGGQRIPDGGHRHTAERFDPHRRRKAGQDLGAKAVHHRLDKHLADRDRGLLQKGIVLGGNAKPLPGRFVVDVFASSSSIC